jgi:hypothetical protein
MNINVGAAIAYEEQSEDVQGRITKAPVTVEARSCLLHRS